MLYSLLRVGIFAGVLPVLLLLQVVPWLAAIIAAVVGLCVTYIFFRDQREAVARSFWEFRNTEHRDADGDIENDAIDEAEQLERQDQLEGQNQLEGQRGGESESEE